MSFMRRCAVVVLALAAVASVAAAQSKTTGDVVGRVTDETGAVLPGVTVEAQSPALQGMRDAVTDGSGNFRLSLLPPGTYKVTFKLQGFATEARTVDVGLGKDVALNLTLRAATAEEITVTAEAPVIDTTTAAIASNLGQRQIQTLPTGRNYSSIVQVVPGTSSDANAENNQQASVTVYGSAGNENAYYIDGVNTTGVEYGFQGKELNFEFIQEVDVKTGGYEAEYGKSTGGIINVITKSGGNEFHGDVFGYYDNDSLQDKAEPTVNLGGTTSGFTKEDYGIGLGGYLVKDRIWFYGAYDKVKNTSTSVLPEGPLAGTKVDSPSDRKLGAGKLTFNLAQGHSLVATFFQDPRTDTGAIVDAQHTLNGGPTTYNGERDFGGKDYALRYEGLIGNDWAVLAQGSRHEEKNSILPGPGGDVVQFRDLQNNGFQTGGFGLVQDKSFKRQGGSASLTRFLGNHEIKGGIEYDRETADVVRRMSGGQQVDVAANPLDPSHPIYIHHYWTTPDATIANAPVGALIASPEHKNSGAYLQDHWSVRPNLSLSFGLRWDRQEILDASGVKQIDLKKDYAPRLGFTWDPSNKGEAKVYGSYGRYYESIPMDLVIRSFSYERQPRIVNFSPTSVAPDAAAEAAYGTDSAILGGFTEPSDPNLKNQYVEEYLLGYERQVAPDLAVGIKGIYRSYGRVIEDFLCRDDGTYCIGNPGEGIMKPIFTLDYSHTLPAPQPKRIYKGVQLDATKRFSNNWQLMASYLYSKLDGNFDGEYAPFTNVGADPNISAAYDYYDFFTNGSDLSKITNKGPLSNDRRHQLKVSGVYMTPFKLAIGWSAYWRSGTPITRYGYSDAYGRYEFFLTTRGAEGRTPDNYEADVHLGYPITAGPVTINLLFDVFNLLNAQKAVLVDQRWGFQEADNASPTPVNPDYKQPILRTPPRALRLGLRLSF